jgi:hypothetical protein
VALGVEAGGGGVVHVGDLRAAEAGVRHLVYRSRAGEYVRFRVLST